MIIDVHAHVLPPVELLAFQAVLRGSRGAHGLHRPIIPAESLEKVCSQNIAAIDAVGTDIQLLSPRPFLMMHSDKPHAMVNHWTRVVNDTIHDVVQQHPKRFRGMAGLPQTFGSSPVDWLDELDRALDELGFVGAVINPDPSEGGGYVPPMGDPWWYPLYEHMCKRDVPALIHSAGCCSGRESYSMHFISEESLATVSLLTSRVYLDFPDLKLIMAHGGGSVPYQLGRWRADRLHPQLRNDAPLKEDFRDSLRRIYFDTCVHEQLSLELLIRACGHENVLFGTENPGSGSVINPDTGRSFDDVLGNLAAIEWLHPDQKASICDGNARRLFSRMEV